MGFCIKLQPLLFWDMSSTSQEPIKGTYIYAEKEQNKDTSLLSNVATLEVWLFGNQCV